MKLANLDGRAILVADDGRGIDVEKASEKKFSADASELFARWDEFVAWAKGQDASTGEVEIAAENLDAPSPRPLQILGIGLNYADHAAESGFDAPTGLPPVFPKFLSSLTGPVTEVVLPENGTTDWEVELVAVIGKPVTGPISEEQGWDHVAGLTVGNDISDRAAQFSTPGPQFGLGKSYPGFSPTGPWIVTLDEIADRDNIHLTCTLDGETIQDGNTSDLIVSVPGIIAKLSEVIELYPGDLIFTGTPAGVGHGRDPKRYISDGQELVTSIDGIGELRQKFVAKSDTQRTPKSLERQA